MRAGGSTSGGCAGPSGSAVSLSDAGRWEEGDVNWWRSGVNWWRSGVEREGVEGDAVHEDARERGEGPGLSWRRVRDVGREEKAQSLPSDLTKGILDAMMVQQLTRATSSCVRVPGTPLLSVLFRVVIPSS